MIQSICRYVWYTLTGWSFAFGYAIAYILDGDDLGERDRPD